MKLHFDCKTCSAAFFCLFETTVEEAADHTRCVDCGKEVTTIYIFEPVIHTYEVRLVNCAQRSELDKELCDECFQRRKRVVGEHEN